MKSNKNSYKNSKNIIYIKDKNCKLQKKNSNKIKKI